MNQLERALSFIASGRDDDGIQLLSEMIGRKESLPQALAHRAFYYRGTRNYHLAHEDYEELLRIAPDDPMIIAYMADVKAKLGLHEEAIILAARALQVNPKTRLASDVIRHSQEALGEADVPPAIVNPDVSAQPLNPVIQKLETDAASFPGSVFPEIGRVLYTIVRMIRPAIIFETGTFLGYSGLCMAQALEDIGAGHLHCFDLFPEDANFTSPVLGTMKDNLKLVEKHFEAANLRHRVTFHRGDSSQEMKKVATGLSTPVQMAFIDGDHTIKGCAKDWDVIDSFLPTGGIVLLHDTHPERCGWLGPRYLLETLKAKNPNAYQLLNLPTPEGFGLGLMQKMAVGRTSLDWQPNIFDMARQYYHLRIHGKV